MIGYQWPNVARRVVTCMNPKWTFQPFFLMCTLTTIHPPPQDLRGLKLSKLRNFHCLKNWINPLYFAVDILRQLLDPSDPPRRVSPFQNIPLFLYPHYALPPAIEFHLPNTFSLNTCATVIFPSGIGARDPSSQGLQPYSQHADRPVLSMYGLHFLRHTPYCTNGCDVIHICDIKGALGLMELVWHGQSVC